tara:strand:- start:16253 stop:16699 length:447 start_codon:yes stop_codon:yes gene_type:complete
MSAAVSLSTIRSRFSTQIKTISGFTESRNPFDGYGRSPNTVSHQRFAVGITGVNTRDDDRQKQPRGVMCETTVLVRYPYRIRPKDQVASYDNALDSAESVMRSITTRSDGLHEKLQIRFQGLDNELSDSGEYLTITLNFNVLHYLSLT